MNITTPCCNAPLLVETSWSGYTGGEKVDSLTCTAYGCYNTWEPDGIADPNNEFWRNK